MANPDARITAEQATTLLAHVTAVPDGEVTRLAATTPPDGTSLLTAGGTSPRPPARRRRWIAAGLVAALVLGAVVGVVVDRSLRPEPPDPAKVGLLDNQDGTLTVGDGGDLPEFRLDSYPEGGCVNGGLSKGRHITSSAQVDCDEPHDLQRYEYRTVYSVPDDYEDIADVAYPDRDELFAYAERLCAMSFHTGVVTPPNKDQLFRFRAIVPSRQGWDDGWRRAYCVLYRADGGQLTESVTR